MLIGDGTSATQSSQAIHTEYGLMASSSLANTEQSRRRVCVSGERRTSGSIRTPSGPRLPEEALEQVGIKAHSR